MVKYSKKNIERDASLLKWQLSIVFFTEIIFQMIFRTVKYYFRFRSYQNGESIVFFLCRLKGLVTDFTWGVHETVFSSEILSFFLIPVDFMGSRIGAIASLLLQVDHFGPIHDTIKSTIAAIGIEKN